LAISVKPAVVPVVSENQFEPIKGCFF